MIEGVVVMVVFGRKLGVITAFWFGELVAEALWWRLQRRWWYGNGNLRSVLDTKVM